MACATSLSGSGRERKSDFFLLAHVPKNPSEIGKCSFGGGRGFAVNSIVCKNTDDNIVLLLFLCQIHDILHSQCVVYLGLFFT